YTSSVLPDLHSFPTRRSSDLHVLALRIRRFWHRSSRSRTSTGSHGWHAAPDGVPGPRARAGRAGGRAHLASCSAPRAVSGSTSRSEEHTSELQSLAYLVCRLL